MRRRPQEATSTTQPYNPSLERAVVKTGLALSGGGARAAYQVGALKALVPYLIRDHQSLTTVIGSSIGAINGLIISACIKDGFDTTIEELESLWRERTFRNTFRGSPSMAFLRAIKMAMLQYLSPGPNKTSSAIFDPTPLMQRIDRVIEERGGLTPDAREPNLFAVGVMTTVEGPQRRPLLFLSCHKELDPSVLHGASFDVFYTKSISAKHGFASAALPSVLPPVELDLDGNKVKLVDGGISHNIPVDPVARLGAERVIVIDISGRDWWLRHYGEAGDTRPTWEVPADEKSFCQMPPESFVMKCQTGLGQLLKESVGKSRGKFMTALGPVWPVFQLLRKKCGEEVAFEAMTYVALDQDYLSGLIERGYNETLTVLKRYNEIHFTRNSTYEQFLHNSMDGEKS